MIRLREFSQFKDGALIEREMFALHWCPQPPPPDGMPGDNITETRMRPVDYNWLETTTLYGNVNVNIPSLPKGALEFESATLDVTNESCVTLSGCIQIGLLGGKMMVFTGGDILEFDQPVDLANERVYKLKVAWDTNARVCCV